MTPLTLGLIALAGLLLAANGIVSLFPKKGSVKVTFIPPTPASIAAPGSQNKLDAHIQSTNHKISALFGRVEALEKSLQTMLARDAPAKDQTWLQTVPVRTVKKKSARM